ncbi:MAG: DUF3566 domain-containing protein [Candidatus Diapherotrites archaeon]
MQVIRKIGVLSYAKICAVFGALGGVIQSIWIYYVWTYTNQVLEKVGKAFGLNTNFSTSPPILEMVLSPVLGLIFGFIIGAVIALIYNLLADKIGGVEVELQ